jgi:hypothetical protein
VETIVRTLYRISALFLFAVVVCSVFIHPFGRVKEAKARKPLLQGANMEPMVYETLRNSCRNCHSEETRWPWYSYVAPVEWLIERDVREARGHFNMSRWDEYSPEEQTEILAEISFMIRNQKMPLRRYLFMHPGAKLNVEDIKLIDQWGRKERKRVKTEGDRAPNQQPPVEMSPL